LVDTEIIGHYLNHFSNQWLCFFFIFEEKINAPIKIIYNELPDYILMADKRRIECRFSDALYFFSTFKKLEIRGMTNLQDFFYDKTIASMSKQIDNLFIYSHLVAIVDPETFSVNNYQRGDSNIQKALIN